MMPPSSALPIGVPLDPKLVPDWKPRWKRQIAPAICPRCQKDYNHSGALSPYFCYCVNCGLGWSVSPIYAGTLAVVTTKEPEPQEFDPLDLIRANMAAREIINALSADKAADALKTYRDYPDDLAQHLADRGFRFGRIRELRTALQLWFYNTIERKFAWAANELLLWLPVKHYRDRETAYIVAFQLRRLTPDAEPRYLTLRLTDNAPLVHVAPPSAKTRDTEQWTGILVTEGIFKAEIAAHFLGIPAVGALGTATLKHAVRIVNDAVRLFATSPDLFRTPVILAPDSDARDKASVARVFWTAYRALSREGYQVIFAVWTKGKGIDDALLTGEKPTIITPEVWLATLKAPVRDAVLKAKARPRMLLDYEIADALDLSLSPNPEWAYVAETYTTERRKEVWIEHLRLCAELTNQRTAVIVADLSAAGTGKTKAAATLRRKELVRAGLSVKRLVYIAPEVKRPAVQELERWRLFHGRDTECAYYSRLQELEREGLARIGKRICAHCPTRKLCGYFYQRQSGATYWRMSWQSYDPREGDFVILDEFSRLPYWRSLEISLEHFRELVTRVNRFGIGNEALREAMRTLQRLLEQGKDATHELISSLFAPAKTALDDLAHEALTLISDIRPTRAWVFGKEPNRPQGFWWVITFADILREMVKGQIWSERGTLKLRWLDPKIATMVRKASGILILDATADPSELGRIFGAPVTAVKSDDPEVVPIVYQVPLGTMTRRTKHKRQWLQLARYVLLGLQAKGLLPEHAKIGIITHKDAADAAKTVFGAHAIVGWWGRDERATNVFYDQQVRVLVCVGTPHRNVGAVAAERFRAGEKKRALRKAQLDAEGKFWTVLREFEDRELAAAVRQETAISYLQAAGRLRQNRRSEQCYMVVIDTEPLPPQLNPIVIPPEEALPPEALALWQNRRRRGVAAINALRTKVRAERLAQLAHACEFYRRYVGEDPPLTWLARALGMTRMTAWRMLRDLLPPSLGTGQGEPSPEGITTQPPTKQVTEEIEPPQREHEASVPKCNTHLSKRIVREGEKDYARMNVTIWHTPLVDAVAAFLREGYPVPYRALARRYGIHHFVVVRLVRKLLLGEGTSEEAPTEPLCHAPAPDPTPKEGNGKGAEREQTDALLGIDSAQATLPEPPEPLKALPTHLRAPPA